MGKKSTKKKVAKKKTRKSGKSTGKKTGKSAPSVRKASVPAVAGSFARIVDWFEAHQPQVRKQFKQPVGASVLTNVEKKEKLKLPADFKAFYGLHNGSGSAAAMPSSRPKQKAYALLPAGQILKAMEHLKELYILDEDTTPNVDPGIADAMLGLTWIPFAKRGARDYLCVDLSPGRGGKRGQIIEVLWRSERRHVARSMREYLNTVADSLDDGIYAYRAKQGIVLTKTRAKAKPAKPAKIKATSAATRIFILGFEAYDDQTYKDVKGRVRVTEAFCRMTRTIADDFRQAFKKQCAVTKTETVSRGEAPPGESYIFKLHCSTTEADLEKKVAAWVKQHPLAKGHWKWQSPNDNPPRSGVYVHGPRKR